MTTDETRATSTTPVVEHFFRHESGRLVAALVRAIGARHLDLAEECVQEAFLNALRTWPMRGVPDRPDAWLYRTARNRAVDQLRRSTKFSRQTAAIATELATTESPRPDAHFPGELVDDRLRLVFLCCDPLLGRPARVALTLKVVAGFSTSEIARAFLTTESTIAQRVVRAKKTLREADAPFAIPATPDVPERLDAVLDVLYLIFSEGYLPHEGDDPLRRDLTEDAIRLVRQLLEHPAGKEPRVYALLALMLLQSSRFDARLDQEGALIPLPEQDRSRWSAERISEGLRNLDQAGRGTKLTEFHLLAGISACHAAAAHPDETDWARIVSLYDGLMEVGGGDVVRLNRAVAVGHANGPQQTLDALDELAGSRVLADYSFRAAARADACQRLGRGDEAHAAWQEAARLATNGPERRYYERRAADATDQPST